MGQVRGRVALIRMRAEARGAGTNTWLNNSPNHGSDTRYQHGAARSSKHPERVSSAESEPGSTSFASGTSSWGLKHIQRDHYHNAGRGKSEFSAVNSNPVVLFGLLQLAHQWRTWVPSGLGRCALMVDTGLNTGIWVGHGSTSWLTVIALDPATPLGWRGVRRCIRVFQISIHFVTCHERP